MAALLVPDWMRACDLPAAWHGQPRWCVLETDFASGDRFLSLWQQWAKNPLAPQMLHVVALSPGVPEREMLQQSLSAIPELAPWADEALRQWFGLLPGFHRLALHGGRLQLTLCVGAELQSLRELQFCADSVLLGQPGESTSASKVAFAPYWDVFGLKALAQLCRRGTQLALQGIPSSVVTPGSLPQAGFTAPAPVGEPAAAATGVPETAHAIATTHSCTYQPHWQLTRSRQRWHQPPVAASRCIVIGAGLAGAAAAGALARRGWQVTVLDAAAIPAGGASALPVGLLLPHVSRDDCARSRLSRAGIRLTLQAVQRLLVAGVDYSSCGVAELALDHRRMLPGNWTAQGRHWSDDTLPADIADRLRQAGAPMDHAIWHPRGSWVKPARLVHALLAQPGIRFQGNSAVAQIARADGAWQLHDAGGKLLGQAPQLVLANAGDSARLAGGAAHAHAEADQLPPLTPVRGQMSWAHHTPGTDNLFLPFAVNGAGSVIAHVPHQHGPAWFAGATYEKSDAPPTGATHAHAHNRAQLDRLLPRAGIALTDAFAAGAMQIWQGTRWSTADRLPLVGSLLQDAESGLWVSTAMGSRGLSLALLCAEVLAAQLCGEPLPLPARLARLIAVGRQR